MDEINQRLKETGDQILAAYDTWAKAKKDSDARENLLEAVHELRKVASRLEIELALAERDEMAERPLPIPPHRAQQARTGADDTDRGDRHNGHRDHHGSGPRHHGSNGGGRDVTNFRRRQPYSARRDQNGGGHVGQESGNRAPRPEGDEA